MSGQSIHEAKQMKITTTSKIENLVRKVRGTFKDTGESIVVSTPKYATNWYYTGHNKERILESILRNLRVRQS